MSQGVTVWSKTAASNASADSAINWAEGMAPSQVNDSARGQMASVAKWRDDLNGSIVTSGTSTAYTATSNQDITLGAGAEIAFQVHTDCGATVTLNVTNGSGTALGAKPLRSAAGVELVAGALKSGSVHRATYFTSNSGEWLLQGVDPTIIASNQVVTASIADANVTYDKIQNVTNNRLLGNFSGSAAAPSEYSLVGPVASGSVLTFPFPAPGTFSNLSIKVASNTTVACAADYVSVTDGTNYLTVSPSATINLGTSGTVNALDTGAIAIDTWYAIFAIAKSDGTSGWLASTSATAPTLPSGYTFKRRYGWVQTIHASATLYGTWQLGRRAQYVVGLAQTSAFPIMGTGSIGTIATGPRDAISLARFVPATASEIYVTLLQSGNGWLGVAPNASFGGSSSTSNPPPLANESVSGGLSNGNFCINGNMLLESSNIYWASNTAAAGVFCAGWVDNI